jgi:hypothetical protein
MKKSKYKKSSRGKVIGLLLLISVCATAVGVWFALQHSCGSTGTSPSASPSTSLSPLGNPSYTPPLNVTPLPSAQSFKDIYNMLTPDQRTQLRDMMMEMKMNTESAKKRCPSP